MTEAEGHVERAGNIFRLGLALVALPTGRAWRVGVASDLAADLKLLPLFLLLLSV